ncbi:MAG: peptide/nickel transport system ATP-binding protein [Tepidanaerobacteraceae bacterium]|nr:peptide/nickel transport system ATP-binding protein [Tepidanaerobacteraceae bacterium]
MSTPSILNIQDLHVWFRVYGGVMKVLDGVDFEVNHGEKVGLVGESGCGKTTTMKSILRILPRQAIIPKGKIIFQGHEVLTMKWRELQELRGQKISMIFQDPTAALNPVFTIGEQIKDTIKYSGIAEKDTETIKNIAIKALRDCAMPDPERIMKNYPFQLSGGMRQRVCIAMALATASNLLIADEPTTNLDVTIQDQVLNLIRTLVQEKGTSLILITHSLGVAREMTDRIYVMYAGRIVEMASTQEIFEKPYHPYTRGLLNSIPKLTGEGMMVGIPGHLPNYLNPPSGCRFHPRCDDAMPECRIKKPPFIEVNNGHKVACFLYKG